MEFKESIGIQIKKQRKLKKKTQRWLADNIGKTVQYVGYIEQDKREPYPFDLANIEKVLDFKVEL